MSIYHRYASGDLERPPTANTTTNTTAEPSSGSISRKNDVLGPMRGGVGSKIAAVDSSRWPQVAEHAHYFIGFDPTVFGAVVILVFKNVASGHLCTRSVSKYGVTSYNDLMLDRRSRFAVACDNLIPEYRHSKLRKALAVTLLKNFSILANNCGGLAVNLHFDETTAGEVASAMQKLRTGPQSPPQSVGQSLLRLGSISGHRVPAYVVDAVYPSTSDALLPHLGNTVNLFDPLLEYSPQAINVVYTPPDSTKTTPTVPMTDELNHALRELLQVQTNYTMNLVNLLQDFIVPLRLFIVDGDSEAGVARINRIFPPTVDEITRVNCILHDALVKAEPFGVIEVLRAMALIVPYFYKPFIRHQANLKHFHRRFDRFYRHYHPEVFDAPDINRGGFSVAEIDSIVSGAVGELPKLKLLLDRIVPMAIDACGSDERRQHQCHTYWTACVDIIDAFGDDGPAPASAPSSRVFTPSGQMLVDLASNWPSVLDHGWLHRKVVGIFELRRVVDGGIDVLVVFSDYLMWLSVSDAGYATGESPVYVSDTLMHSLVNEKPLPTSGVIPSMSVRCWTVASECLVSSFDDHMGNSYIRFLSTNDRGFSVNPGCGAIHGDVYSVLPVSGGKRPASPDTIVELVAKSMVVNKAHSLRLSRSVSSDAGGARTYFASQTADAYSEESSKSPFALFLEVLDESEIAAVFEANDRLRLVMTAHICEDDRECLVVSAQSRSGSVVVDQRLIAGADLPKFVRKMVNDTHKSAFDSSNGASRSLIALSATQLQQWCHDHRDIASQSFSPTIYPSQEFASMSTTNPTTQAELPHSHSVATAATTKQTLKSKSKSEVPMSSASSPDHQPTAKSRPQSMSASSSKRRSFIGSLFSSMSIKRRSAPPGQLPDGFTRSESARKNLDSTFIPRGQRHEYKHLYSAQPDLVTSKPTTPLVSILPTKKTLSRPKSTPTAIATTTTPHDGTEAAAVVSPDSRRPRLEDEEFTDASSGSMLSATPSARRSTAPTSRQSSTKDSMREPNVVRMGSVLTKADTPVAGGTATTATAPQTAPVLAPVSAPTSTPAPAPAPSTLPTASAGIVPIIGTPVGLRLPPSTSVGSVDPNLQRKSIFKVDLPWHSGDGSAISEIMPECSLPTSDSFNANMYSDGGSNWISITRDNSSLFIANGADLTAASMEDASSIKADDNGDDDDDTTAQDDDDTTQTYEAIDDEEPVKPNNTSLALSDNQAENLVEDFVTRFDRDYSEMFTPEEIRSIRMASAHRPVSVPRSDSVQSVTPSMYARELSAQLDRSFSSRHLLSITQQEYETKMAQARGGTPRRLVSVEEEEEELGETPVRYQGYSQRQSQRQQKRESPETSKRFSAYVVRRQEARYSKYNQSYDPDVKYAVDRSSSGSSDATIYDDSDNVLDTLDYRGIALV